MPLEGINISKIKSALLKKLETMPHAGLFLSPLITTHGLTADEIDALILGLTTDDSLRVEGEWKNNRGDRVSEVTFVRGPTD